jgi:hypothetical protein
MFWATDREPTAGIKDEASLEPGEETAIGGGNKDD